MSSTNYRKTALRFLPAVAWALPALLALASPAVADGVTVALTTSTTVIDPGAEFVVSVDVTKAGMAFNGFDAVIGYDPAALTPISSSPTSLQEGTYMKSACGLRFHRFQQGFGRDTVTDVLMCNGVAVTGPGQIYQLRFRASIIPQTTQVHLLPKLRFYNDGVTVPLAGSSDATIGIGMLVGVGVESPSAPLRLQVLPNPARRRTSLLVEAPNAGIQELSICDLMGRTVRHLGRGYFDRGSRQVAWDCRSDSGERLRPGLYLVRLSANDRCTDARVIVLD